MIVRIQVRLIDKEISEIYSLRIDNIRLLLPQYFTLLFSHEIKPRNSESHKLSFRGNKARPSQLMAVWYSYCLIAPVLGVVRAAYECALVCNIPAPGPRAFLLG